LDEPWYAPADFDAAEWLLLLLLLDELDGNSAE
jgi:hypothetical protein